jgi:hypothetical protein
MAAVESRHGLTHEDDRFGLPVFGIHAFVRDAQRYDSVEATPTVTPVEVVESALVPGEITPPEIPPFEEAKHPVGHAALQG